MQPNINMSKTYNASNEITKYQNGTQSKLRSTAIPSIYPQSKYRSVSPITTRQVNQVDELKESLLKVKDNFNKKTKEIRDLKLVFNRLNQDHRVNVKIIENILKSANRVQERPISDIREQIIQGDFSQQNISTLKETHHTLILKRQNQEIKAQIEESVKKLEDLKDKTKIVRLNELENNLKIKNDEIQLLSQDNEMLREQVEILEKRVAESNKNVEATRTNTTQLKNEHQELLSMLQKQTEQNEALKKTKMNFEERTSNQKFCITNLKQQLKQNDDLLKQHEKIKEIVDKFVQEKSTLEKAEEEKRNKLKEMTNDLQSLNEKAKQLEGENAILVDKIEIYEKERARCLPYLKDQSSTYKEKDKKINQLEEIIKKETADKEASDKEMNNKIKQLDDEIEKLMCQIDTLNTKVAESKLLNATIEGEIQEATQKIQDYEMKALKDNKTIEELNRKLSNLTKANEDNQLQDNTSNENSNVENKEDIEAKMEIKELDLKIQAYEELLAQEKIKQKENEKIIKKLTEESENKKEINELNSEIDLIKKEINDLKKAKTKGK